MKILVCVKYVPDTETKIKVTSDGKNIDSADFKYMLNPYDEFAIEEALKTQEKMTGESVVVCVGPSRVQEGMRKALAMGVDRGVWISTEGMQGELDSAMVAECIAKVVESEKPDVVFCGQRAIDDDCGHVGPMLGELCSMPHLQVVMKLEWQDGGKKAVVEREVEGGMVEVYEVETPVVLGAHKSLNTPRFPSLPNIMKAKKKPIEEKKASDLLTLQPSVSVAQYQLPPEKAPGKIFKDEDVNVMVAKVVGLLRSEAKVI